MSRARVPVLGSKSIRIHTQFCLCVFSLNQANPVPFEDMGESGQVANPPVLLASFGNDPSKRTVCVYGHLDVQPARMSDGWNTEPFELTEVRCSDLDPILRYPYRSVVALQISMVSIGGGGRGFPIQLATL